MAASHPEIINILTRPQRTLHPDRFATIFNFITLQVQAVAGHHDSLDHYIYTVFAGRRAYLGRTSGERNRSTYVSPGISTLGGACEGTSRNTQWEMPRSTKD